MGCYNLCLMFIVYRVEVLNKVIAEIWEHGSIATISRTRENKTSCHMIGQVVNKLTGTLFEN